MEASSINTINNQKKLLISLFAYKRIKIFFKIKEFNNFFYFLPFRWVCPLKKRECLKRIFFFLVKNREKLLEIRTFFNISKKSYVFLLIILTHIPVDRIKIVQGLYCCPSWKTWFRENRIKNFAFLSTDLLSEAFDAEGCNFESKIFLGTRPFALYFWIPNVYFNRLPATYKIFLLI